MNYMVCLSFVQKTENDSQSQQENVSLEFPVAYLYELENRVFTESWSIPYKKEESLGKCLIAATRLAVEGDVLICYHFTL